MDSMAISFTGRSPYSRLRAVNIPGIESDLSRPGVVLLAHPPILALRLKTSLRTWCERKALTRGILGLVADLWRMAEKRTEEFDAQALIYDRYRPRYPESVFDDIVSLADLASGGNVAEVGAGTGIATLPLFSPWNGSDCHRACTRYGRHAGVKGSRRGVRIIVGRFEDFSPECPMSLLASFNAWHWIEPRIAVERTVASLEPGGWLALV